MTEVKPETQTPPDTKTEEVKTPETKSAKVSQKPEPDRSLVPYFENNGIPYCPKCFQQYRSGLDGSPICADDRKDCPRTK